MGNSDDNGQLAGREAELAALGGLAVAVAAGRGGVAWIEGEPGIGKSALVAAVAADAAGRGCAVFTAAADQLRGRFPLGVLLDGLGTEEHAADAERAGIAALLRGDGAGGLVPAGDAVTAAGERILALVDHLCAASPVLLAVDDLQWADPASVSVWHRLAGAAAQIPLLMIAAARPVPRPAEVTVARHGVAARGGEVLRLGPLTEQAVADQVAALVAGRPGPRLLAQAAQAGGNPLYVRELVDALVREDRLQDHGGVAELSAAGNGPVSLAAAIEERLGFVSGPALSLLRAAALLGARFSVRDLVMVDGRPVRELAVLVGEAVTAGILAEAGPDLVFRHGLIQQALADRTPAGPRAELQRAAARALARAGASADRVAAQLLARPGPLDEWAVGWLAGHAAELVHHAPGGAVDLLERALAGPAADAAPERREALAEQLGRALFLLGRYEQAEPVIRGVLTGTADPARQTRVTWMLGYTLLRMRRGDEALALADQALAKVGSEGLGPDGSGQDDGGAAWPARLHALRALAELNMTDYPAAVAAAAAAAAGAAGDRFALGYALHAQATERFHDGDDPGALALLDQALTVIGNSSETADLRVLLLINRMAALALLDRDATAAAAELLLLAEQTGSTRADSLRYTVAQHLYERGRWDDSLVELDRMLDPDADADADPAIRASALELAALIAAHRDDPAIAVVRLATADRLPQSGSYMAEVGWLAQLVRAVLAERAGRPADAAGLLSEVLTEFPEPGVLEMCLHGLVRCALAAGNAEQAAAAVQRGAAEAQRRGGLAVVETVARWCQGVAAGDATALAEAAGYYRRTSRPLEYGQALEDLAVVRARAGDMAGARVALREAVETFAGLGAEWDVLRADVRLRELGVRRPRGRTRRPATGWAALSPTELKVAYLVGAGLSNPEIGARLFLSRYTVQVHVSKILAKLQLRSRIGVAAEVARRDSGEAPAASSTASSTA